MGIHQALWVAPPSGGSLDTVFLRASDVLHGGSGSAVEDFSFINEYFNGGTNSQGASGPNLGLSFTPSAAIIYPASDPSPHPYPGYEYLTGNWDTCYDRQLGIINLEVPFFEVTKASGFTGSFSFTYIASTGASLVATVYDAGGGILVSQTLPLDSGFASPQRANLPFAGVATRVRLAALANQLVVESMLFGEGAHAQGPYTQLPRASENFTAEGTIDIGFNADGSIYNTDATKNWVGSGNRIPYWYTHVLPGIGNSYWVRASLVAGTTPAAGSMGTWINVGTEPRWTLSATCTLRFEFATDSGGTNIVFSTKQTAGSTANSDWRFIKT